MDATEKVFAGGLHERVFVVAADLQRIDRSRRPRKTRARLPGLIREAAARHRAAPHVIHRVINRLLRHVEARVFRRTQRDDLQDRHGNVRIAGPRLVAPAAPVAVALALCGDDEPDRALQFFADDRIARLPVQLAERDGRDAVVVHVFRSVHAAVLAVRADAIEQEFQPAFHLLRVIAFLGQVARRHECEEHVARHGHGMLAALGLTCVPRAVHVLLRRQPSQRAAQNFLCRRIHDDCVLRRRLRRACGTKCECAEHSGRTQFAEEHVRKLQRHFTAASLNSASDSARIREDVRL